MKKTYLLLSIGAGLVGGLLSSALRPIAAQAQSQALDEIKAQRFTLVNQSGVTMGAFSFDDSGRPQIVLRDDLGHEVWKMVAEHRSDHPGDYHVTSGKFHSK
ncbi:MAG: hypothetical protein LAO79_00305 [Acidobacteriia bacterium]|nr:hypothetical protein [Terriglobia bacterium]